MPWTGAIESLDATNNLESGLSAARAHAKPRTVEAGETDEGAEVCRRFVAGDQAAFGRLVRLYQDRIYSFCLRLVGERSEAEDLAQEVFLSVYKNAGAFRGDSSFTTWIYRIARNRALNRIKYLERRGRSRLRSIDDVEEHQLKSGKRNPHDTVEGQQTGDLVRAAIAELPEQQRTVLVLRDIEGLAYEDITDITGLALGTVKSRIHRARSSLAGKLARKLT